jgi:hypothetical protein
MVQWQRLRDGRVRYCEVELPAAALVGGEQQLAAAVRSDGGDLDRVERVLLWVGRMDS